ncbi:hypothetical protein F0562_019354 [Nyssa sinensis]|uniref:TF-B3 domain-containing protein n=1 Tax=Nyssa sinensis TaxID=561372 RepID=A0A5J4ZC33_9ASTE|nr:hypothetical protein F0562_019354 [Nyssa sinensis]
MVKQTKTIKLFGKVIDVSETNPTTKEKKLSGSEKTIKLLGKVIHVGEKEKLLSGSPVSLPSSVMDAIQSMGGSNLEFLVKKRLENSDVCQHLNRLYIPKSQALLDVLTDQERVTLEKQGKEGSIDVTVLDSREWSKLVGDNNLREEGSWVELWSFRVNSKLCFVVNSGRDNGASSSSHSHSQ